MTFINRDFLKEVAPDAIMEQMASPVFVRSVRLRKHSLVNYATIDIYFPRNKHCIAAINQEVHVVNGFKSKMVISIDILSKESFIIDIENKSVIKSCKNIDIPLEVAP